MGHYDVEPVAQMPGSDFCWQLAPFGHGSFCGVDSATRLSRPHFGDRGDDLTSCWIEHIESRAVISRHPLTVDISLGAQ